MKILSSHFTITLPIVPYDGGAITIGNNMREEVLSTSKTVELWAIRNGCDLNSINSVIYSL